MLYETDKANILMYVGGAYAIVISALIVLGSVMSKKKGVIAWSVFSAIMTLFFALVWNPHIMDCMLTDCEQFPDIYYIVILVFASLGIITLSLPVIGGLFMGVKKLVK